MASIVSSDVNRVVLENMCSQGSLRTHSQSEASYSLGIYNESFETSEWNMNVIQKEICHAVVPIDVTESYNDVHSWDLGNVLTKYKSMCMSDNVYVKQKNIVFGAENVLQLPPRYSHLF